MSNTKIMSPKYVSHTFSPLILYINGEPANSTCATLLRGDSQDRTSQKAADVVLMIECKEDQLETVRNILWEHNALGVRKLILGEGH